VSAFQSNQKIVNGKKESSNSSEERVGEGLLINLILIFQTINSWRSYNEKKSGLYVSGWFR